MAQNNSLGDAFVSIGADQAPLDKALADAERKTRASVDRASKAAHAAKGGGFFGGFMSHATSDLMPAGMAGAVAGGAVVAGQYAATQAIEVLHEMVRASMEAEYAQHKLTLAVTMFGGGTEKTAKEAAKYAEELMLVSTYSEETIKNTMALGMQIGIGTDKIKDATKAAIGLAAKLDIDVSTAMQGLARLQAGGSARWMTMYGIVDKNVSKMQQYNQAVRAGISAYSAEEAKLTTVEGAWKRLNNAKGKAYEEFGQLAMGALGARDTMSKLADSLFKAGEAFAFINEHAGKELHSTFHAVKAVFNVAAQKDLQGAWTNLKEMFDKDSGKLTETPDKITDANKRMGESAEETAKKEKAMFGGLADAWKKQQSVLVPDLADPVKRAALGIPSPSGNWSMPSSTWNAVPAKRQQMTDTEMKTLLTEIRDSIRAGHQGTVQAVKGSAAIVR